MLFQTSEKYFQEVLAESHTTPVLVDFYASWCAPCRILAPELDALSEAYPISAYSVNTDKETNLTECYHVNVLPTVILFQNGQPAARWENHIPVSEIIEKIRLS